tara:strand:- start:340 stop:576 length:237 start_codon:yes stop_codon:yes gene_type:complete
MQALIHSELKLKRASFDESNYLVNKKINNSKFGLDFKFYQKLFVIILTSCSFLIIPESPKNSEILCKKYHSAEACTVW